MNATTINNRPATYDDLVDYQRQGHLMAHIPSDYITRYPSLGQHLLAALAEAHRLGLDIDAAGLVRIPLTADELDAALASAQWHWDTTASWYAAATYDPAALETWKRNSVNSFCANEGLEAITWPEVSA